MRPAIASLRAISRLHHRESIAQVSQGPIITRLHNSCNIFLMEHSSPLAAMQPTSLPIGQWGWRNERQDTCGPRFSFGPSSFDFRDLSMNKPPTDYFNLKPVRGSSPTASLAADLSQNFHIDRRYAWVFPLNPEYIHADLLQPTASYTTSGAFLIEPFRHFNRQR